jgi:hypothetical protein
VGVAVPLVLLSGCSDGQLPAVQQVAAEFTAALGSGDLRAGCGLLSPAARDALEYQDSQACEAALGQLALPGGDVVDAVDWGGEAQVHTTTDTLFLTRTGQGWRIAAAGCRSRGEAPYACKVQGS